MFVVDTVPYTKRTHLVLRGTSREGCEYFFPDGSDCMIHKTSGAVHTILGEGDERSIRVNRIMNCIVSTAVRRLGLGKEHPLDWKVVIPVGGGVTAGYIGGGWILITRGLLSHLNRDVDIAFVLAHEVAHGIARHLSEMIIVFVERHHKWIPNFLAMPLYRRQELEADYIGIMLVAASGFDPHTALEAHAKVAAAMGPQKSSFFSPSAHPSWKKRSRYLSRRKVMEEAMELCTKAISGGNILIVGDESV